MDAVALAAKRKHDNDIFLAWHVAAFSGAAQAGKLKSLSKYLTPVSRPKPQTASEMLDILREFKAMGAPMTIEQIN
jgi:hypothetical protein